VAFTVNWLTKLVTVPLADLTLVSGINYTMDVDAAHDELRRLEWEFTDGLWAAQIIEYIDSQLLSGIVYSPIVKMVNGYTWEIDASNINVALVGANTNLLDTYIPSMSVSILVNNSGGKIVTGSGLDAAQTAQLRELHANEGLETGNPMTVTTTNRSTDDTTIDLDLTGDGVTSTTVTRQ
jgi:hypothetical protein